MAFSGEREIRKFFRLLYRVGHVDCNLLILIEAGQETDFALKSEVQAARKVLKNLEALKAQLAFTPSTERRPSPLWIWSLLLEQGQQIFAANRERMARSWADLGQTTEVVDMTVGLQAVFCSAFCFATYHLGTLQDGLIASWLDRTSKVWKELSTCDLRGIDEKYQGETEANKCLLLDAVIERTKNAFLSENMYISLATRLKTASKSGAAITFREIEAQVVNTAKNILEKTEVRELYRNIFVLVNHTDDFEQAYESALRVTPKRAYNLLKHWSLYGVTLRTDQFYIDSLQGYFPQCLEDGYHICMYIHEFAHMLLRKGKTTWRDFHCIIPPPCRQKAPMPEVHPPPASPSHQEEVPAKRPGSPLSSKAVKRPRTDSDKQISTKPVPSEITAQIASDFAIDLTPHEDGWFRIEDILFQGRLEHLRVSAAKRLLDWAGEETGMSEFTAEFKEANEGKGTEKEQYVTLARGKAEERRGYCGTMSLGGMISSRW